MLVALLPAIAGAGLCGDSSGNGYFTATDALAPLRLAVEGGYDRRGDTSPPPDGNGVLSAADALENLRAAVEERIPPCHGRSGTRAALTAAPYDFFGSGGFAVVDVATRKVTARNGAISGDAVIRVPGGTPVVVNRKNFNSLQLLDAEDPGLPTVKECSVSDGFDSNPQDVVFVTADKGYVTPYAGGELLVVSPPVLFDPDIDPACNGMITGRVDLSGLDDDGVPQMDQMLLVDDRLFVSLQRLDEALQPDATSLLAVIDVATDTVTATVPLTFRNPFAETKGLFWDEFQERIFVGGPGDTGAVLDDGGIEAIDPVTLESDGLLLSGSDIDANIFDFVVVGTERVFAIVADLAANSVVDIDLRTRSIRRTLLSSTALITDIELTELGELWIAYRGESAEDPPGIRIFDAASGEERTTSPLSIGQAPFTIAFFD